MKKKFSEVLEIKNGKNQKSVEVVNGAYPIFGSGGEMGRASDYICEAETVIIGRKGTINNPLFVNEPFWNVDTAFGLCANRKILFPKYLYHFCKSFDFNTLSTTVTIPSLTKTNLLSIELPLPSLPEQQKIAAHLDSIQSAIDNKKQQLQQLDELVKSKFVEMFGENPVESGKWKVEKLGNLCSIGGGYAFKSDKFLEDGIPVLRIGNINAGFFRPTNMVYWENDDKLERYAIYPGDLVMSLTGTAGKEDYGNICVLGDEYPKYFLNQRNAKFTDLKNLNKLYLANLLKLQDMKQKLTGLNHGVRQGNILNKDLENLEIPVPPIELQNTFAEYVQKIDSAKSIIKTQLVDLQELLDSKMDEYFGE